MLPFLYLPLICSFIYVPYSLDHSTFVVSFKIRQNESSNFVLLQDDFRYSGSLEFPYKHQNQFAISKKNATEIRIALNVQMKFGRIDLSILGYLIHEHGLSHLFRSSLFLSSMCYVYFSAYRYHAYFLGLHLSISFLWMKLWLIFFFNFKFQLLIAGIYKSNRALYMDSVSWDLDIITQFQELFEDSLESSTQTVMLFANKDCFISFQTAYFKVIFIVFVPQLELLIQY